MKSLFLPLLIVLLILQEQVFSKAKERQYDYEVSVCAMFQNEAKYLKEWLEFHKLVGVEHFYLYNNLSTDNFRLVLAPYIKSKEVTLIEWPYKSDTGSWLQIQIDCYSDVLKRAAYKTKWLACLDVDEFLMPVATNTLGQALVEFESFGGVCVNWQLYGTSFIKEIPKNKLTIEMLLLKSNTDYLINSRFKSIVRPERAKQCRSPHFFLYNEPFYQVATTKEPIKMGKTFSGPFVDKLRINHYWCRDEKYFNEHKLGKRQRWGDTQEFLLERYKQLNMVKDDCILRFVPRLRKIMGLK